MKLCSLAVMVWLPVLVYFASTLKRAANHTTAESGVFNFDCWASNTRMPDPQRLLQMENEVLHFQFSPGNNPAFFPEMEIFCNKMSITEVNNTKFLSHQVMKKVRLRNGTKNKNWQPVRHSHVEKLFHCSFHHIAYLHRLNLGPYGIFPASVSHNFLASMRGKQNWERAFFFICLI